MSSEYFDPSLSHLIPVYLKRREADLVQLEQCLEGSDFEGVYEIGHKIKGTALNYGFGILGEIGVKLENASRQRDEAGLKEAIVDFQLFLKKSA